jgi:excisionase family DNA binding protein
MHQTDPPVSIASAAKMLKVSRSTVLRRIATGEIAATKMGENTAGYVIDAATVRALVDAS